MQRSAGEDSLELSAGWCWVARAEAAPPAHVHYSRGVVVVPGATQALVVVEADGSTFATIATGAAHVEVDGALVPLPTGSIAHVPVEGGVTVDVASPGEMARDALLARNLELDLAQAPR